MPFFKSTKLTGPAGEELSGDYAADYDSAEKLGPFRVGAAAFYYRDGLRRACLPYTDFDQVFKRAMLCSARHCGGVDNFDTFWLVFCRAGEELCSAKTIDEKFADAALARLSERVPELKIGL